MIASEQVEVLGELDLVREQQRYRLNTLLASVNIVADKQKLLVVLRVPSYVKQSEQIKILSVHIAENFNWRFEIQQHLLRLKHFGTLIYKELERLLIQLYRLAPLPAFDLDELLDDAIGDKLFLVISGWLYEVLTILELLNHFVDLPWVQIVLRGVICDRLAILAVLSGCNSGSLALRSRVDLILHYFLFIYIL